MAPSRIRDGIEGDLEEQIAGLRKDVSFLAKAVSKRSANAFAGTRDGAHELYEDVRDRFSDALPTIRKQARVAGKTIHDNPVVVAAVVGVVVAGLLISLLARR